MSTTPPPDRPTQALRRPRRAPLAEERVVAPVVDPHVLLLRVEHAIDGLRTWLAVIGLIAVAALGVAIYALLHDRGRASATTGSTSALASSQHVATLDKRVDDLSRRLQSLHTGGSAGGATPSSNARLEQLESAVKTLSSRPATGNPQQAIDELSGRIDDLAKDVEALKQAPASP